MNLVTTLLLLAALVLVPLISLAAVAIAIWSCAICDNAPHNYPAALAALVAGASLTYGIAILLKRLIRLQPNLW